jgi:hypothetical protein
MKLSDFLALQAQKHGSDVLLGSMVFVNLDRPLDQLIRHALALGQSHPGQPSPWSHCFLLAEPYGDKSTPILDCTIRDGANAIIWNSTLKEDIEVLTRGMEGREGKIYSGRVSDYDDPHVLDGGLYFLPGIVQAQRQQIVQTAKQLQSDGYRYDLPGLLRELCRLLFGVTLKPISHKLLFCSAFLAKTYRDAVGMAWDVVPQVASVDVTPDEIWFSPTGSKEREM